MAQLAIKGHATRGEEVIKILEMLGGNNKYAYVADSDCFAFYIGNETGNIYYDWEHSCYEDEGTLVFTIEEFLEKFPYKVGNKVSSKYLKNYKIEKMEWEDINNRVIYKLQGMGWYNADELQPYKEETMEDKPNLLQQLKEYFENTPREVIEKEWHEYDKYNEINPKVNEYLEYVNNIRQPKYPKTYEECYKVLNTYCTIPSRPGYKESLIAKLQKLLICCDAYWKIAGDWKPNWTNGEFIKYSIRTVRNTPCKDEDIYANRVLAFPTEEMRDAFYENFKELIEECKELL